MPIRLPYGLILGGASQGPEGAVRSEPEGLARNLADLGGTVPSSVRPDFVQSDRDFASRIISDSGARPSGSPASSERLYQRINSRVR